MHVKYLAKHLAFQSTSSVNMTILYVVKINDVSKDFSIKFIFKINDVSKDFSIKFI